MSTQINIQVVKLDFKYLRKRDETKYLFFHHSVKDGTVQQIHAAHLSLGWSGIGYHFYVRKDGSIWRGRPLDSAGAHADGYNYNSIAVCAEGNFEREQMSEIQKRSVTLTAAYVWEKFPGLLDKKHKDVNYTACPGRYFPYNEIVSGAKLLLAEPATPRAPASATPQATGSENCIEFPDLVRGTSGSLVESMQVLLIHKHKKSCGRWGADGSFGAATHRALNSFQNGNNLPADGICDIAVWRKLLGV